MKTLRIILFLIFLGQNVSGQSSTQKYKANLQAQTLIDSIKNLFVILPLSQKEYQKIIVLSTKAIKIDKNYLEAYQFRELSEFKLKQYNKALITAKVINKLSPNNSAFLFRTGLLYEKLGDTISSTKYFKASLTQLNKTLDTMNHNSYEYYFDQRDKGIMLILLNEQLKGNQILNDLNREQANHNHKELLTMYLNKSREEIFALQFGDK